MRIGGGEHVSEFSIIICDKSSGKMEDNHINYIYSVSHLYENIKFWAYLQAF